MTLDKSLTRAALQAPPAAAQAVLQDSFSAAKTQPSAAGVVGAKVGLIVVLALLLPEHCPAPQILPATMAAVIKTAARMESAQYIL